jgi:hypothetical protein
MKRDPKLIRALLHAIEAKNDAAHRTAADLPIEGFDRGQVSYHLRLLYEAGFVSGEALRSTSNPERIIDFWVFDLTWQGHEFLAAARDNVAWKTVLTRIGGEVASVPFSVLTALLIDEAKKRVGLT